MLIHLVS